MACSTGQTKKKKYLKNICANSPHIVIHHKALESKIKGCMNIDHFHMIAWHPEHPTATHSFIMLKRLQATGVGEYEIRCQKVYTLHGLAKYLTKEPEKRIVVAASNITTNGQKAILSMFTNRQPNDSNSSNKDTDTYHTKTTIRGNKDDFIKKIIKSVTVLTLET